MRISVVIPSFNRAHSLPATLQSVYEQTSAVDEVIVVDDGSTDNSRQLVTQQFPEVRLIVQPNQGVSAARNQGILAARHEWIALLDSDDRWLPHKIETIRAARARNPDYILYHSDEIWVRHGVRVNPMHKHRKQGGWIFEHCLPLCAISPSAAVIQNSTLQYLGLFDETLPACEDYDLWLRLCHQFPVHYTDEALITKYGGHDDQLSQKFPIMDRFRIKALLGLLSQSTLKPSDARAAREILKKKLDILLNGAIKHGNQLLIDEFGPLRDSYCGTAQKVNSC